MKRKKVVLFIVEGPSDQSALELVLSKVFDQNRIFVQIAYGDITSDSKSNPSNIVKKVNDLIKMNINRNRYSKSDMLQVIHLMDTDGTYIKEDAVKEVPTASQTIYGPTQIIAPNKEGIVARNRQKAANMDKLATLPAIGGIPYLALYMSCNLDHVLYNKVNSTDKDKQMDAFKFAKQYRNDIPAFVRFITESDFSVMGVRSDTWDFIRDGLHSLERHTNLGICLPADSCT